MMKTKLRIIREQKGMTRGQLSAISGVPYPSVAAYEVGRRIPSISAGIRIADALGIHPRLLLDEEQRTENEDDKAKESYANL